MLRIKCYYFIAMLWLMSGFMEVGHAQPTSNYELPAIVGPQNLSSSPNLIHEFFTQDPPNEWKGDITGIVEEEIYWVYVMGIDATGVTGPAGREVQFNLQDAETGSSFKHLGISFSLNNAGAGSGDLLKCYQANGNDGLSTNGLDPGELTRDDFDLRFQFSKASQGAGWDVTPYYRLSDGTWTEFFDGSFTGSIAFDFLGAKLVVSFTASAADTISFDNFFVIGPISGPITGTYVDDDWAGLADGDAVQFPGQAGIQIIGVNAFATVQEGIDGLQIPDGPTNNFLSQEINLPVTIDTVNVAPGTYSENVEIYFPIVLDGAGSGSNPVFDTIINSDADEVPVIIIDGEAGGASSSERLEIRDLRVTGATGDDNAGSGILINEASIGFGINTPEKPNTSQNQIQNSGVVTTAFITFENVASVDNEGSGIVIDHSGDVDDIEVINCDLSNNDEYGFVILSTLTTFEGLTMTGGQINNNGINGLNTGPSGSSAVTDVNINGTSFSGNGNDNNFDSGDINFFEFNGDASLTNVSITGDGAHIGLQISGFDPEEPTSSGTVSLNNVSINGTYQYPNPPDLLTKGIPENPLESAGSGLLLLGYSDVSGISFTDVGIDVSPAPSSDPVVNLNLESLTGVLDLGNTTFGGNADMDILNLSSADATATGSSFTSAADGFAIEDRVVHRIDFEELGLVRWTPNQLFLTLNSFFDPETSSPSLQRAFDAAASGDTVNVDDGAYAEGPQLLIDKDLTLIGSGKTTTTVEPTDDTGNTDDDRGWFLVEAETEVHVRDISFDGDGFLIYQAFRHKGAGSFDNVGFTEIKYNESGPDYAGTAIVAFGDGAVDVSNCTFNEIGRIGVLYFDPGVSGSVFSNNTYTGKATGDFLDYGVEVGAGAVVTIQDNFIFNNMGVADDGSQSAGILVTTFFGAGTQATIDDNEIFNCTSAVHIGYDTEDESFVIIKNSDFHDNSNGVKVSSALFARVEKSQIYDNTNGVDLEYATVFDIDQNQIYDNSNDAIRVANSIGGVDNNTIYNNGANGISILDETSTETTVHNNEFCTNSEFALENLGTSIVDATGNWWGASNGPGGAGPGNGDAVSVGVDFSAFETSSLFQNSPCSDDAACFNDGDVNNDEQLTPSDALCAFQIYLNEETVPASCDVPNFDCEVDASDVDCNSSVTPGDGLAIFLRYLSELPPEACFNEALTKTESNALSHNISLNGIRMEDEKIKINLVVKNPAGLDDFGLKIGFPTDKLEFLALERSALTLDWTALDARANEAGQLTVGGFTIKPISSSSEDKIFHLIFLAKDQQLSLNDITISKLVGDFESAVVEISDNEIIAAAPTSFRLHQNYPNPFNPTTRIQFEIPETGNGRLQVSLKIYNISGQLVRTLVNETKAPGVYQILWDGESESGLKVPSGAYFYTISAGDFKETRKMLLLK